MSEIIYYYYLPFLLHTMFLLLLLLLVTVLYFTVICIFNGTPASRACPEPSTDCRVQHVRPSDQSNSIRDEGTAHEAHLARSQ